MRRIMLSKEESVAISLIRILAVILIISCHILQALDNKLAWWLNVGVQIFFFISGYLVAIREIKDYNSWIIKRFKRVYQQYYLFVAIILLVYIMFFKDLLNIQNILAYLVGMPGILGSIKGLGHLWYVPVIMLCYLIVPLIESYKISSKQKSEFKFISKTITTFIFMQLLFVNWGGNFATGIATFVLGYYFADRYNGNLPKNIKKSLLLVTLILIPINVYLQNTTQYHGKIINRLFQIEFAWHHVLMGSTIFIYLFDIIKSSTKAKYFLQPFKKSKNILMKFT